MRMRVSGYVTFQVVHTGGNNGVISRGQTALKTRNTEIPEGDW